MTEQLTTLRRTSTYTIRLTEATPERVEAVRRALTQRGVRIIDLGDAAVSYRSAGDTDAMQTAAAAMEKLWATWTLTTGLGVHRRTVEG
jgi:uncharacterized protein with GYD domain